MDELEFRRRLLADPQARDPQLQQQLQQSEASQRLQQDLLQMEQQLKQSVQLPVPPDLADRLLLAQGVVHFSERQKHRRRWLAIAAAVLCLGLISPRLYQQWVWPDTLAEHSLAHVYHEAAYLVDQNSHLPLTQVNELLSDFHIELMDGSGVVRYARYCDFQGHRSLHLILQTPTGTLTVFVMPPQHGLKGGELFADQNFHGQSMQLGANSLVLVAGKQYALQPFADELQHYLRRQI